MIGIQNRAADMEDEARMFWRTSSRTHELYRTASLADVETEELHDELDALGEYTSWPLLRRQCEKAVRVGRALQEQAAAVA